MDCRWSLVDCNSVSSSVLLVKCTQICRIICVSNRRQTKSDFAITCLLHIEQGASARSNVFIFLCCRRCNEIRGRTMRKFSRDWSQSKNNKLDEWRANEKWAILVCWRCTRQRKWKSTGLVQLSETHFVRRYLKWDLALAEFDFSIFQTPWLFETIRVIDIRIVWFALAMCSLPRDMEMLCMLHLIHSHHNHIFNSARTLASILYHYSDFNRLT